MTEREIETVNNELKTAFRIPNDDVINFRPLKYASTIKIIEEQKRFKNVLIKCECLNTGKEYQCEALFVYKVRSKKVWNIGCNYLKEL